MRTRLIILVAFVAVVGDDEKAANTVAIKDMKGGDQQTIGRSDVPAHLTSRIQGRQS